MNQVTWRHGKVRMLSNPCDGHTMSCDTHMIRTGGVAGYILKNGWSGI